MAYFYDKVRSILRLKLGCVSNKKKRASLDQYSVSEFLMTSVNYCVLRFPFTCDTMNEVYALTCSGYGHNYIGQTERAVRDWCGDYRRAVIPNIILKASINTLRNVVRGISL